jgi:hypothetical protein
MRTSASRRTPLDQSDAATLPNDADGGSQKVTLARPARRSQQEKELESEQYRPLFLVLGQVAVPILVSVLRSASIRRQIVPFLLDLRRQARTYAPGPAGWTPRLMAANASARGQAGSDAACREGAPPAAQPRVAT